MRSCGAPWRRKRIDRPKEPGPRERRSDSAESMRSASRLLWRRPRFRSSGTSLYAAKLRAGADRLPQQKRLPNRRCRARARRRRKGRDRPKPRAVNRTAAATRRVHQSLRASVGGLVRHQPALVDGACHASLRSPRRRRASPSWPVRRSDRMSALRRTRAAERLPRA
jgi:hypothetical protein